MLKYNNIVVGVDGSENDGPILNKAIDFAKELSASLYIVSAIQYVSNQIESGYSPFFIHSNDLTKISMEDHTEFVNSYKKIALDMGVENVEIIVDFDDPEHMIVGIVKNKIDTLLVLGATNKKTMERLIVGSVTEHLVNHAPCDIFIVRKY